MKKLIVILLSMLLIFAVSCARESVEIGSKEKDESVIKIGTLKGPTSFGMSKFISDLDNEKSMVKANVRVLPTPDKIIPMLIRGDIDFACVPTNIASILYNKTEGNVKLCAVNTLGVLHLVGNSEYANKINSISDLKGMELTTTGKGGVPEYVLLNLLEKNNLEVGKDVKITFSPSHQELAKSIVSGNVNLAVVPQPFATISVEKGDDIQNILDLDDEWKKIYGDVSITTGCIIARKDFLENNPELADQFLSEYEQSINWVNKNPKEASNYIKRYGIFPKAKIAEKAIPKCNMVYLDGEQAKTSVTKFLTVLYKANPKSVGGKMPKEDFFK